MSTPTTPRMELESLFVGIYADYKELVEAKTEIKGVVDSIVKDLSSMAGVAEKTAASESVLTKAIAGQSQAVKNASSAWKEYIGVTTAASANWREMFPSTFSNLGMTTGAPANWRQMFAGMKATDLTTAAPSNWRDIIGGMTGAGQTSMEQVRLGITKQMTREISLQKQMMMGTALQGAGGSSSSGMAGLLGMGKLGLQMFGGITAIQGAQSLIHNFIDVDRELVKVMAHMRDFGQESRQVFERGIFSKTSPVSPVELAKGLDILASSGMSAGMSVKAMGIAERFAVASGMEMQQATKSLVDIQYSLGMASENVGEHYANMTKLSDMFIGSAYQSHSTVEQLTAAFSGDLSVAIRNTGTSLEDAIGLIKAFSVSGIKGQEAGDRLSRAMYSIRKSAVENHFAWEQFGIQVYDSTGKMRSMVDILYDVFNRFEHLTPEMQQTVEAMLHLETRSIKSLEPIKNLQREAKQWSEEAKNMAGKTQETADVIESSLSAQFSILWNKVKVLGSEIGEVLTPVLKVLVRTLEAVANILITVVDLFQSLSIEEEKFSNNSWLPKELREAINKNKTGESIKNEFNKVIQPSNNQGSIEPAMFASKNQVGFNFRQISQERYMIGGPVAESLDQQQLNSLRNIANNTAVLPQIAAGILGGDKKHSTTPILGW